MNYDEFHRQCWQRLIEQSGISGELIFIQDDAFRRQYDAGLDPGQAVTEWMSDRMLRGRR